MRSTTTASWRRGKAALASLPRRALGFGTLALISVFKRPLEAEFGWSRAEISLAYGVATIAWP